MIEYIKGKVDELTPTQAVIEAHGVGYLLFISLNTYSAIQGKTESKLYVYEAIREDAYQLFGFSTKEERELFLLLISVSGVGGQTARMILSAFTPAELTNAIRNEDIRALKSVKGIGPKAAQRIIVDLKDKMKIVSADIANGSPSPVAGNISHSNAEEAIAALTMLGFPPAPTQKVVLKIVKEHPELPVEQIVKQALKMI